MAIRPLTEADFVEMMRCYPSRCGVLQSTLKSLLDVPRLPRQARRQIEDVLSLVNKANTVSQFEDSLRVANQGVRRP